MSSIVKLSTNNGNVCCLECSEFKSLNYHKQHSKRVWLQVGFWRVLWSCFKKFDLDQTSRRKQSFSYSSTPRHHPWHAKSYNLTIQHSMLTTRLLDIDYGFQTPRWMQLQTWSELSDLKLQAIFFYYLQFGSIDYICIKTMINLTLFLHLISHSSQK